MAERAVPVVCLPGIRGHAHIFSALVAHVAQRPPPQRVALLPLHLPPGPPALAAARLLPQLPTGPFRVLTGSYGGLVARFLPHARLATIASIGTLPHPQFLQAAARRRAVAALALPDRVLEAAYSRQGRRSFQADGVPAALIEEICHSPVAAPVLRARLRAVLLGHHGTPPPVPTLWLHGHADPQVVWSATDVRRSIPHAQVRTVPGRHFPHASHPAALWDTLLHLGWAAPTH